MLHVFDSCSQELAATERGSAPAISKDCAFSNPSDVQLLMDLHSTPVQSPIGMWLIQNATIGDKVTLPWPV